MNLDDELCLCFHVTTRKVINYIKVERPRRPGQLAECFGAGTGCGWCRPYLRRLFEEHAARIAEVRASDEHFAAPAAEELDTAEYARRRAAYVRSGKGTPPAGATPIDEGDVGG